MSLDGWSDSNRKIYPRIESFVKQNKTGRFGGSFLSDDGEVKNVFKSLDDNRVNYPTLLPVSSKLLITDFGESSMRANKAESSSSVNEINTFGEYKLSWEDISFMYCIPTTDKDGKTIYRLTKYERGYPRVCEVNFAVTNPYLIQKSPYGIGKNKTTIDLSTYKLKNGTTFMDAFRSLKTSAEDYQVPKEIATLFTTFKNKYSKVAKQVKGKKGLYKVPGKSIYLFDGQERVDLVGILGGKDTVAQPFTFIAKNKQDILIKGNLNSNAMIMTEGQIIIDASSSCNGVA